MGWKNTVMYECLSARTVTKGVCDVVALGGVEVRLLRYRLVLAQEVVIDVVVAL